MWVLPTFGRPARCQQALCSITSAGVSSPGLVVIDGNPDPAYANLPLPPDWRAIYLPANLGVCGVFNHVLQTWKNEPWYGFISDDSIVRTRGFDKPLVAAAGRAGFANSADGWQGISACMALSSSAAICSEGSVGGPLRGSFIASSMMPGNILAAPSATGCTYPRSWWSTSTPRMQRRRATPPTIRPTRMS